MKSKVYFIAVKNSDNMQAIKVKFARLLGESNLLDFIPEKSKVAIKMHFGEEGNTGYVRPEYVRLVCDRLAKKQADYFLSDTNTLYRGRRMNSQDHLKLAHEHGFTKDICGADIIIPDEAGEAEVAGIFLEADVILGIAHFKGHMMTGIGGALKNIGMGCATRRGKLAQHSDISPFVRAERCVLCKKCIEICPAQAVSIKKDKAYIDPEKCIGCASCIAICPENAVDVDWEAGGSRIQEKMVEYAGAVLKSKAGRRAFINFAVKITKECDCLAKDDPRISPDVGILLATDPVSIDKASLDLITKAAGRDIFREAHPSRDAMKQLQYACSIGLGSLDYELVEF